MNLSQFKGRDSESNFSPLEAGTYNAVCSGIIDLGTQSFDWNGEHKQQPQLLIMFDFPTETVEIYGEQKPRCISATLTKSVHEKSTFRKHLISWRGKDFTPEELSDFSLRKLIGVPATVSVIQKEVNGKTYANISSIGRAMKGVEMKATRRLYFDLADADTYGVKEELPDWVLAKINKSAEAIISQMVFAKGSVVESATADSHEDSGGDVPF